MAIGVGSVGDANRPAEVLTIIATCQIEDGKTIMLLPHAQLNGLVWA